MQVDALGAADGAAAKALPQRREEIQRIFEQLAAAGTAVIEEARSPAHFARPRSSRASSGVACPRPWPGSLRPVCPRSFFAPLFIYTDVLSRIVNSIIYMPLPFVNYLQRDSTRRIGCYVQKSVGFKRVAFLARCFKKRKSRFASKGKPTFFESDQSYSSFCSLKKSLGISRK